MHSSQHKHIAFVLSLFDTGLAAIRSLGRAGIPVIGLDSDPKMPGFKSRYCTAKICPSPTQQPKNLMEFLLSEGKKLDYPGILFPASDAFVLFVSRYRKLLRSCFNFILPPSDIVEMILDKHKQYELAERVGLSCPETHYPDTIDDLDNIRDRIKYPVFVKPYYAHLWRSHFPHKGFRVNSFKELVEKLKMIWSMRIQAMVQSVILGPSTNNYEVSVYISKTGKVSAVFAVQKLRQYPPDFGTGTLVESVHFPELVNLGLKFLQGINYRGVSNIEFKIDERDGQLKFIEINARLWQQNDQATACGIDFPLMEYQDLIGEDYSPQLEFPKGVKWLDILSDFQSFWHYFLRGELSIGEWLSSWKGVKAFAVFAWDDLMPALYSVNYGFKLLRIPQYLFKHLS